MTTMNDDPHRRPPPPRDTEGPLPLWAKASARLQLVAHPAHIGPLGLGALLCAHNVSWAAFLAVGALAGLAGAITYGAGTDVKSEVAQHVGVALVVWAGIFGILGSIFGVSS